jgi:hypothetical protein
MARWACELLSPWVCGSLTFLPHQLSWLSLSAPPTVAPCKAAILAAASRLSHSGCSTHHIAATAAAPSSLRSARAQARAAFSLVMTEECAACLSSTNAIHVSQLPWLWPARHYSPSCERVSAVTPAEERRAAAAVAAAAAGAASSSSPPLAAVLPTAALVVTAVASSAQQARVNDRQQRLHHTRTRSAVDTAAVVRRSELWVRQTRSRSRVERERQLQGGRESRMREEQRREEQLMHHSR